MSHPSNIFFQKTQNFEIFLRCGSPDQEKTPGKLKMAFFLPNYNSKHILKYILSLISTFWVNCTSSLGAEAIVWYFSIVPNGIQFSSKLKEAAVDPAVQTGSTPMVPIHVNCLYFLLNIGHLPRTVWLLEKIYGLKSNIDTSFRIPLYQNFVSSSHSTVITPERYLADKLLPFG